jgi:rare lipoprotein A (peptidoglycan hydrolase)
MLYRMLRFFATSLVMTAAPAALAQEITRDAKADATVETGMASVYASDLEGRLTASGALYDSQKLTAAHRSLPLGSRIRVTDAASGKSVSVAVNDRWGGGPGQIVNLSHRAAAELGLHPNGQRRVEITVEALGDGRRQASTAGSTPRLLPDRIEATASNAPGRARVCANEADILGLKDVLWESHVRNCLGRKSKPAAAAEAKAP